MTENIRANTDAKSNTKEPRPDIEIDGPEAHTAHHGGLASADINRAESSHQVDIALKSICKKRTRAKKAKLLVEHRKIAFDLFTWELEKLRLDLQHAIDEHDSVSRDLDRIDSVVRQCKELEVIGANGVNKRLEDLYSQATTAIRTKKSAVSILEQRVKAFAAGEHTYQVALMLSVMRGVGSVTTRSTLLRRLHGDLQRIWLCRSLRLFEGYAWCSFPCHTRPAPAVL